MEQSTNILKACENSDDLSGDSEESNGDDNYVSFDYVTECQTVEDTNNSTFRLGPRLSYRTCIVNMA